MASQVVQRANNASNLYATIKSRGSNTGPAGCGYIYASEVNQCPCYRHKVKVTPQNSPGFDRTVRFELPNYGFLEHVFLESLFGATNTDVDGTDLTHDNVLGWASGAFVFSEARLVFRGQEVARVTSDYIMTRHLIDLSQERLDVFLSAVGGLPVGSVTNIGGATTRAGRYKLAQADQRFYCPLSFWFAETRSRALDLSILHSPLTLEVDVVPVSKISTKQASGIDFPLKEMALQCYLAELPAPELKMFRDVSYKPGGEPLSQLGYDILTATHNVDCSSSQTHRLKLNDFSGLVQRLYIFAVLSADRSAGKNLKYIPDIKTLRLLSVDTEIYERENMGFQVVNGRHKKVSGANPPGLSDDTDVTNEEVMTGERLMDFYLQPSKSLQDQYVEFDYDVGAGSRVIPAAVQVINFKSDWDQRTSATGSLSFGTLHNPTLEIEFGSGVTNSSIYVIVIAELNNVIVYSTNSAGATSIRRITE